MVLALYLAFSLRALSLKVSPFGLEVVMDSHLLHPELLVEKLDDDST